MFGGGGNQGQYAQQAWQTGQFMPYNLSTPGANISYANNGASSTLNPQMQGFYNSALGTATGNLNTGYNPNTSFLPQQYSQLYGNFNNNVNSQYNNMVQAQMPFLQQASQSNLDNEFAKGTLGSTAGGYQTAGQTMGTNAALSQMYNQAYQNTLQQTGQQWNAAQGTAQLGEQQAEFGPQFAQNQTQGLFGDVLNTNALAGQQTMQGGQLGALQSAANTNAISPLIQSGINQDQNTASLLNGLLFGGGTNGNGGFLGSLLGGGSGGSGGGSGGLLGQLGSKAGNYLGSLFGGGGNAIAGQYAAGTNAFTNDMLSGAWGGGQALTDPGIGSATDTSWLNGLDFSGAGGGAAAAGGAGDVALSSVGTDAATAGVGDVVGSGGAAEGGMIGGAGGGDAAAAGLGTAAGAAGAIAGIALPIALGLSTPAFSLNSSWWQRLQNNLNSSDPYTAQVARATLAQQAVADPQAQQLAAQYGVSPLTPYLSGTVYGTGAGAGYRNAMKS